MEPNFVNSDHDLLIRVDQKVDSLTATIQDIKDGTLSRLNALEKEKADRSEIQEMQTKINDLQKHINENVETRTQKLERMSDKYLITLALYTLAVGSMIGLIIYHILH